ncbi:MAG TPA: methyltransferase domain-containing protein [Candidatus Paceibacterota bacterium]|nr:methyltransferase domain-containing protein [Candidatus Paceibacterota bacterium]
MRKTLIRVYEYLRKKLMFLKRRLVSPRLPENPDGKIYLNLGCAGNSGKEFTNIDVEPYPNIHHIQNIMDLSNFKDDSVDMVYASHVVEHIPRESLHSTLKEWKRVLKHGGVFRFAVPNFDALIDIYKKSGSNVHQIRDQVMGQNPPYHNHYTLWNFKYAKEILEELGYTDVKIWDPNTVDHHDFNDRSTRSMNVGGEDILFSLNVEATKP